MIELCKTHNDLEHIDARGDQKWRVDEIVELRNYDFKVPLVENVLVFTGILAVLCPY